MANLQKTTAPKFRRKNSCPDGWLHAGAKVPIRPDGPARGVLPPGHQHPPVLLQSCRPAPTGFAAATGSSGRAGWTSARPSTPASGRTTPSSPRSRRWLPPAPSGTSARPWTTGGTPGCGPGFQEPSVGQCPGAGSFLAAGSVKEIRYDGKRRVKLPCLGSVKLGCTLPRGICYEANIRRENGRWYICLKLWKPPEHKPERAGRPGGIDTGINPLGTDSDGQTYRNPKASYQVEKKLRRWQRAQARRQKGSRGWWEAQRKIDKCHRRIRGLRHNAQHQMTSTVTRKYSELVIEDLHVAGMMRGSIPKAQADAGMGDIKRQLIYKGQWRHTQVILAPMWFPSSKTCSACGTIKPEPEAGTQVDLPQLRDSA